MKRFLLLALAGVLVFMFAACDSISSDGTHIGNKEAGIDKDATENINLQDEYGAISVDETTVKELLSAFSTEQTGLSKEVYDYVFKIVQVSFNGKSACKAEAYDMVSSTPECTFIIDGNTCYRYDVQTNKCYMLSADGVAEVEAVVEEVEPISESSSQQGQENTSMPATTMKTEDDINKDNDTVMHKRFAKYDLSAIGLPKPISEYEFQVTGSSVVTSDGKSAFVVYLLENGEYTDFTFAFSAEQDYYYDSATDEYKQLS